MAWKPLTDAERFDYRVGSRQYTLGGIMQDTDPGSCPPNRPRMVINGRFKGGGVISRPPYSYVDWLPQFETWDFNLPTHNESQDEWDIKFMSEHHPTRQNNQLWAGRWNNNTNNGTLGSILAIADQPFRQPEDIAAYPTVVLKAPQVERYNGEIFVGDTGYLRRIYRVGLALADLPTDDILYTFPGFRVYAMHEYAGRLFVFVADPDGVNNGYVFSYDGSVVYAEVTLSTAGKDGASFAEFKGKLFLAMKGDTSLHWRDGAGSWTFLTDAGFTHSGFSNAMVVLPDALIICGDTQRSGYTEPAGVPTLTVNSPLMPAGWSRVLVGANIGPYAFYGGTKIWPSDTYQTPVFLGPGGDNITQVAQEHPSTSVIPKGMVVFCNRVYWCVGYEDTSIGGSVLGFFLSPRNVSGGFYSGVLQAGVGVDSSIEYLKGDH